MITQQRLKEFLRYDANLGEWTRIKSNSNRCKVGDKVGIIGTWGYRRIKIDGKRYQSARLAWLYMTGEFPEGEIDHIDRNPLNDVWTNLRVVSKSRNQWNKGIRVDNKSGISGVRFDGKKWRAYIGIKGKDIHLGLFNTFDDAVAARKLAEQQRNAIVEVQLA